MKRRTNDYQQRLEQAWRKLCEKVALGSEYPDAHAMCAIQFAVSGNDLAEAYDNWNREAL